MEKKDIIRQIDDQMAPSSLSYNVVNTMFGAVADPDNAKGGVMTFGTFAGLYNILMRFNKFKNEDGNLGREEFIELLNHYGCDLKLRLAIDKFTQPEE